MLLTFLLSLFFLGCSPKSLFPTDNSQHNAIENFNYEYQKHIFFSRDGTKLHGLHIKSLQKSKGILVVANGMHGNASARFVEWLWIVDHGYDVFIADYRAYGESRDEMDIFGFKDDVKASLEYAYKLDLQSNIILVGQSMGGTFVIDIMADEDFDYVSLVVSDSTFTSFASALNSFMLKSVILIPLSWIPYTFPIEELASEVNIDKVETPILLITGDSDWIVSAQNSKILYEKAKSSKGLWIVKEAGHVESFHKREVREAFLELLQNEEPLRGNQVRYF